MRNLLAILTIIILFDFVFLQCANPKAPQGGPRDSIPPTLVNTIPPQGTLNYLGQELVLEFDERITDEKLQANLIITPQVDIKYKSTIKKNRLTIRFEDSFPDSTTMTLNFFDGITDITEKNSAINLSYVFSTGNILDSLSLSGEVIDLLTNTPQVDFLVGVYPNSDTLDYFTMKPYYFTTTNEDGEFSINNIKNGTYRILAFKDDNRNLTFEPTTEAHGFLQDLIQLDTNINNLSIRSLKQNVSQLQLISSRMTGPYFDVRYSKGLDSLKTVSDLRYNFLPEINTVRFYKPNDLAYLDSLQVHINAYDSINLYRSDTLYIKFQESTRKPGPFNVNLSPLDGSINVTQPFQITFTKPVESFNSDLIYFEIDSTFLIPLDTPYAWNSNKTLLSFTQAFDTARINTYRRELSKQSNDSSRARSDSTNQDSKKRTRKSDDASEINLILKKEAFISLEHDSSSLISSTYIFPEPSNNGKLIVRITTSEPSFIIELIDKTYGTLKTYSGSNLLSLDLPAAEYGLRILIDDNQDGIWSQGNLLLNLEPERVYVYPEFTSLRANWDVNIDIQF